MWWQKVRTEIVPSGVPSGVATQMQEQRALPLSDALTRLIEENTRNVAQLCDEVYRLRAENASLLAQLAYRQTLS